ncbi:hypothetical protein HU200_060492 [Digitaria exilis]|uniref:Amino acid transporter transmembrane domain-containing protein n=1 Tax=Digitaria exilis TaxID=1010633 RepID=A0A835AC28_9POAL|nr:hypothetical protein HU200_060492 [Digitaria exilis]
MATTTTTATGNADPPPPSPSPASSKTGFLKTCFNGVKCSLRDRVTVHPLRTITGRLVKPGIFLAIAIVCCYTGNPPTTLHGSEPLVTTYPDIGALAFGRRGRLAVAIFMYLELFLVAVDFLILEGDNLHKLFPDAGFHVGGLHVSAKQGFVLAATLAVLPTTWFSSLGVLAYVSAAAALASVVLVASVMWVAVFDGVGFHERGRLVHWAGLPACCQPLLVLLQWTCCLPMIYNGMKDRKKIPNGISHSQPREHAELRLHGHNRLPHVRRRAHVTGDPQPPIREGELKDRHLHDAGEPTDKVRAGGDTHRRGPSRVPSASARAGSSACSSGWRSSSPPPSSRCPCHSSPTSSRSPARSSAARPPCSCPACASLGSVPRSGPRSCGWRRRHACVLLW